MKQKTCKNATAQPAGFARLARRISTWTTRGLLSAVVLVAGLGFGRQVLEWWRADDSPTDAQPAANSDGLGDPTRLHCVRFGDQPWSMGRQTVSGNKKEAEKLLQANCRLSANRGGRPAGEPGDEERNLLSMLANRKPVEENPGQWRLYAIDQAFPMAVVVKTEKRAPGVSPGRDGSEEIAVSSIPGLTPGARQGRGVKSGDSPPNLAGEGLRVVVWGLAMPSGAEAWALYTFQPESRGALLASVPDIPIPGGCRNTLAIRANDGGAMIGFEGPEEPEAWKRFYQEWFAQQGWEATAPWTKSGANWIARYAASGDAAAGTVDILCTPAGGGRLTGLILIAPE